MKYREHICHLISRGVSAFFVLFGLGMAVYNLIYSTPYYIMLSLASILFAFLPAVAFRLLRIRPVYSLTLISDAFCFLAFTIGMVFHGYTTIPLYDKLVHTLSGIFFAFLGLGIYYLLKQEKAIEQKDGGQAILFMISFSALIAVIWEVFEYILNFILHNDPQKVLTTGVNDTMLDMIVCLVGAVLFVFPVYRYYRKGKTGIFMGAFEVFFHNLTHKKELSREKR